MKKFTGSVLLTTAVCLLLLQDAQTYRINEGKLLGWNYGKLSCFPRECRRQVKHFPNFVQNFKIVEFHDHIWNQHEKYIQKSTNMPGIGSNWFVK